MEGEYLNLLLDANEGGFASYTKEFDHVFINEPNVIPELKQMALTAKGNTPSLDTYSYSYDYLWQLPNMKETVVKLANKEFLLLDLIRKTLQPFNLDSLTNAQQYTLLKLHLFRKDKVLHIWEENHIFYLKALVEEKEKSLNVANNFLTVTEDGTSLLSHDALPKEIRIPLAQTVMKEYMAVPPKLPVSSSFGELF